MKVLLVTNLFPTPVDPERGIFTLQLAKRLAEKADVTVICPLPWFPGWKVFSGLKKWYHFSQVPYQYEMQGVKVYSPKYPMIPKLSEAKHASLMKVALSRCLKSLTAKNHYDVINSQWLYPDSVAVDKVLDQFGIAHIPTGLGCDVNHDVFDNDKRDAILTMLNNSAAITVVSNDLKRVLVDEKFEAEKITVIPNGVDSSQFKLLDRDKCRQQLDVSLQQKIILYVGRLSEEKGVDSLLRAFAQLEKDPHLFLYLVGDGPLNKHLQTVAKELSVDDRVVFVGKVDHQAVSLWMGACDYFTLASLREGCPNVILESLGSGRPVIASNVGAIPDVVTENSGILFEPQNIESITQAFERAFEKNWDHREIAESVKSLSWESAADKYLKVFESASS